MITSVARFLLLIFYSTLQDIEDDLARGTALYLPRIMHRLLYTLTQDRKISYVHCYSYPVPLNHLQRIRLETWQSSLRKQYLRRNPDANPLGPEPPVLSRLPSRDNTAPVEDKDEEVDAIKPEKSPKVAGLSHLVDGGDDVVQNMASSSADQPECEEVHSAMPLSPRVSVKDDDLEDQTEQDIAEAADSKNWLDLSMLEKLDSLHLLTEWQFQNPHRLRSLMKDDGDHGLWVSHILPVQPTCWTQ